MPTSYHEEQYAAEVKLYKRGRKIPVSQSYSGMYWNLVKMWLKSLHANSSSLTATNYVLSVWLERDPHDQALQRTVAYYYVTRLAIKYMLYVLPHTTTFYYVLGPTYHILHTPTYYHVLVRTPPYYHVESPKHKQLLRFKGPLQCRTQ